MASLIMERQGTFTIEKGGPNSCGVSKKLRMKYLLTCFCVPELDERDFLFDQLNVHKYFTQKKIINNSCERMCIGYVHDILTMIKKENPHCKITSISLKLEANPYKASMSFFMNKEDIYKFYHERLLS